MLIVIGMDSCRKKEVFPDLAKQIQGNYNITEASLTYHTTSQSTGTYNPKDSAQTGQITIQKIDALSANIRIILRKQSGEVFFDDAYHCELSRDIINKGWIKFTSLPDKAGAYFVNDTRGGGSYISIGGYSAYQGKEKEIQGSFVGRR